MNKDMINKHNLDIVKLVASNKDGRYGQTGVYFTPEHTIATDSYKMIIVDTVGEKESFEPFIANPKALKGITFNKETHEKIVFEQDGEIEIRDKYYLYPIKKINEEYLDVKRVIPESKNSVKTIKLNAKFLRQLMQVMEKIGSGEVEMEIHGYDRSPIVFRGGGNGQNALGLIMPITK